MSPERPVFDPQVEILKAAELFKNSVSIGFDTDQILQNSKVPVINEVNRIFKTNFREDAIDSWYAVIKIARTQGLSESQAAELNVALWSSAAVLGESVPCRGAVPLTLKLAARGKRLLVGTSRPAHLAEVTHRTFREHFPWIAPERIKIRTKSDTREGAVFKAETWRNEDVTLAVEDSPKHALVIQETANCQILLVNAKEWDEGLDPQRVTRIQSLACLVDLLEP